MSLVRQKQKAASVTDKQSSTLSGTRWRTRWTSLELRDDPLQSIETLLANICHTGMNGHYHYHSPLPVVSVLFFFIRVVVVYWMSTKKKNRPSIAHLLNSVALVVVIFFIMIIVCFLPHEFEIMIRDNFAWSFKIIISVSLVVLFQKKNVF